MNCPRCGRRMPSPSDRFCLRCERSLWGGRPRGRRAAVEEPGLACGDCGSPREADERACGRCGGPFLTEAERAERAAEEEPCEG